MTGRLFSGLAGLAILIAAFTWTQLLAAPFETLPSTVSGLLTAAGVMFGVYLLFYSLTGDWLPWLSRRRRQQ